MNSVEICLVDQEACSASAWERDTSITVNDAASTQQQLTDSMSWVLDERAWAAAGVFALLSLVITCHQIYMHLYHWTKPEYQKWIVRILIMVKVSKQRHSKPCVSFLQYFYCC